MTRSTRVEGILLFCLKENSESLNPQLVPKRLLALAAVSGKTAAGSFSNHLKSIFFMSAMAWISTRRRTSGSFAASFSRQVGSGWQVSGRSQLSNRLKHRVLRVPKTKVHPAKGEGR